MYLLVYIYINIYKRKEGTEINKKIIQGIYIYKNNYSLQNKKKS